MRACPFIWASSNSWRQRSRASCLDLWATFMSGRSEHLYATGAGDSHVDGVQPRKRVRRVGRLAVWRERGRMAGAVERTGTAVPLKLAWQVRADRRNSSNVVAAAEQICTH